VSKPIGPVHHWITFVEIHECLLKQFGGEEKNYLAGVIADHVRLL
jgi:hypothetical protein